MVCAVMLLTIFSVLYLWMIWAYIRVRYLIANSAKFSSSLSPGRDDVSRLCSRCMVFFKIYTISTYDLLLSTSQKPSGHCCLPLFQCANLGILLQYPTILTQTITSSMTSRWVIAPPARFVAHRSPPPFLAVTRQLPLCGKILCLQGLLTRIYSEGMEHRPPKLKDPTQEWMLSPPRPRNLPS